MVVCRQRIEEMLVRDSRQRGFTLIELMIAVVIVSVLAAIAVPIYTEYVRRSARSAGQNYLSDLAMRQELRFQNTRLYTDDLTLLPVMPLDVSTYYQALADENVVVDDPAPGTLASFTITMNPLATGVLAGEGTVTITSAGVRTWVDRHGNTKQWSENR